MARVAYVTGGTGFIGARLVALLLDRGWHVRALVLESERDRLPKRDGIEAVVGDITRPETLRGTMDGADVVYHMAALVATWLRDPAEYTRVNVGGTENVIDEALRSRVPRFVFTSSLSSIGVRPGEVVHEDSPPGKVFGEYEASKAEAERRVIAAARDRGLPAVVIIPGVVIGPGDVRNTGRVLLEFARGNLPGTFAEESILPVVGVDDVALAHLRAYERGRVGSRYIVCAQNEKWIQLLRMASDACGTPLPSRHFGARAVWLATRAGDLRALVTRKAPQFPAWLADFMLTGASMDNTKSVQELGMTYRPIAESIQEAIVWFRETGLLTPSDRASAVPPDAGESLPGRLGVSAERRPKPPVPP